MVSSNLEQNTDQAASASPSSLALKRQLRFWAIILLLIAGFLWLFSDILLPFAAGMVLAYFLDPVADWLETKGMSRAVASTVILLSFLAVLVVLLVTFIPLIATQMTEFVAQVPGYVASIQQFVSSFNPEWLTTRLGINPDDLRNGLNSLLSSGLTVLGSVFRSLISSAASLFSVAGLFVVTPVVAFYMLLDWDRMIARVDSWVPRKNVADVRKIATDINASTAGFVRGQSLDGLILGVMYSVALSMVGLNFAIVIGMVSGLIGFIPYVGSAVGLLLAVAVAIGQFWPEWHWVVVVVLIFAAGQFIEGNFIQPRLVGDSVGLHPVWLMFSLFAFGALFGFVGLLVAVPAAAAIGVLVRFAISRYLQSPLYTGENDETPNVTRVEIVSAAGPAIESPKRKKPAAR